MLRFLLSKLSPPTTPAQRLAVAFAVSEQDAKLALDRLKDTEHPEDDEHRATLLLLYAAKWHRTVHGALEDFGPHLREGLTIWEGTIEGQSALLAWRAAKVAGPFRLRLAVKLARNWSRAFLRDFEKNFATARAAIRRETGR